MKIIRGLFITGIILTFGCSDKSGKEAVVKSSEARQSESGDVGGVNSSKRKFPFTAQEDSDGAQFVCFIYGQSGFPYRYTPAELLAKSKNFRFAPNNQPQAGDVAWWREFVAIYAGDSAPSDANLLTAPGKVGLAGLEERHGPVKWLRYWKDD